MAKKLYPFGATWSGLTKKGKEREIAQANYELSGIELKKKLAVIDADTVEDKAKADIRLLEQALELYRLDMISYPNSREGLQALVTVPENHRFKERYRSGGYVRRLEKDPWGNDYKYRRPGRFGTFDLYSLGADGEEGGEGSDKDIGNWE